MENEEEKPIKKLIALLTALCLLASIAAVAAAEPAENVPFTINKGITFGMNQNDVAAAEASPVCERDVEHTRVATFDELEFENTDVDGVRADVSYFFMNNALVAARMNFERRDISYDALLAKLTAAYGEPAALDAALLGNGLYVVDDDGRPEFGAVVFMVGDVAIVLERDEDDMDVTFLDLTADYIR